MTICSIFETRAQKILHHSSVGPDGHRHRKCLHIPLFRQSTAKKKEGHRRRMMEDIKNHTVVVRTIDWEMEYGTQLAISKRVVAPGLLPPMMKVCIGQHHISTPHVAKATTVFVFPSAQMTVTPWTSTG
jgi:hypothetical protein